MLLLQLFVVFVFFSQFVLVLCQILLCQLQLLLDQCIQFLKLT